VSEKKLVKTVMDKIIEEMRAEPEKRVEVIAKYLPLLVEYVSSIAQTNRAVYARLNYALALKWREKFPDIPVYML